MFKKNMYKQLIFSGIAFGLIALLFGLWSYHNANDDTPKEVNLKSGTPFTIPRQIKPFELQKAPDGKPFTNATLQGHWSMLFFGFTNCTLLCPTTLSSLNQFYNQLTAEKLSALPQVTFISIDPERDSLKKINQFVKSFNKNFKGATGSEAALDNITHELNILYAKVNPNNNEDYQIDHSGTVLVFNPKGHLAALFSPPIDANVLAEDYKMLISSAKAGEK
jgi:protein SCO1